MKGLLFWVAFLSAVVLQGANSCLKCHGEIENIRDPHSEMMLEIYKVAQQAGHPLNDCIVCHGGNPNSAVKRRAHSGTVGYFLNHDGPKGFYPFPGSPEVNANTCGLCHQEQVDAQRNSLMRTEAGRIREAEWAFGRTGERTHAHARLSVSVPSDPAARQGTTAYRSYMQRLAQQEPDAFPVQQDALPPLPNAESVEKNTSLSVYTYLRQAVLQNSSRERGCGNCHIPYGSNGYYKGSDRAIDKQKGGHLLVHSMQSSRDAKVKVGEVTYSGVPVETCAACHDSDKHIGLSYRGIMDMDRALSNRSKNASPSHYTQMQADVHFKKGMLCQDCHTSGDLHGDGFLTGAALGAVEIECQDCHGTTSRYPWELPLGYGDEFGLRPVPGQGRGVVTSVAEYLKEGSVPEAPGGHLVSARGNPLVHTEKKGEKVLLHLASGKTLTMTPLKGLKASGKLSTEARIAMDSIPAHTDKLECYTCHTLWAPQRYGTDVNVDYSRRVSETDNVGDSEENRTRVIVSNAYVQWDRPPLGVNGEGRVSPTIPGTQLRLEVIGGDGTQLAQQMGKGIMSPVQPHTVSKRSRSCESCHSDPKAAGYGTEHGRLSGGGSSENALDRFIDEKGDHLQTVGIHWSHSGPLSEAQRAKLDRSGTCTACHQSIPDGDFAIDAVVHAKHFAGIRADNKMHHTVMNANMRIGAWVQLVGGVLVALIVLYLLKIIFFGARKKQRRWK